MPGPKPVRGSQPYRDRLAAGLESGTSPPYVTNTSKLEGETLVTWNLDVACFCYLTAVRTDGALKVTGARKVGPARFEINFESMSPRPVEEVYREYELRYANGHPVPAVALMGAQRALKTLIQRMSKR